MDDKKYLNILKSQPMKRIKKQTQHTLHERRKNINEQIDIKKEIIKFFLDNPNPEDSKVHELADKLSIDAHKLESKIYEILSNLLKVGKHRDTPVEKFNEEEIKMGIKVEKEHTDDDSIAVEIAKDHLAEIPDYYTRLKKMEDEAGVKK